MPKQFYIEGGDGGTALIDGGSEEIIHLTFRDPTDRFTNYEPQTPWTSESYVVQKRQVGDYEAQP